MSGAGFGHSGAVGEIFDVLPLDSTFHVTDCGYDDNDQRCGCYDLPAKLHKIIRAAQAEALREAADALEAEAGDLAIDGMVGATLSYVNCTRMDAKTLRKRADDLVTRPASSPEVDRD